MKTPPAAFYIDPATPAFEEFFPGVTEHCAPLGLERMGYVTTREYPVNANWKVYVDNYLEGYYIPLVHPGLNRELDYRQYLTELGPRHTLQHAPVREGGAHYGRDGKNAQAFYHWKRSSEPLPNPEIDARWNELARFSEEVQAEDAHICEAVQLNIGSRAYQPGPYSPKRESGVRLFHQLLGHS